MYPARGSKTATEAARAGRGSAGRKPSARRVPAPRLLLAAILAALVVVWVGTSVPGFASQPVSGLANGTAGGHALKPVQGAASGPVVLVRQRKPRRNSGKAVIGLFKATPSTVAPSGGTVHLDAVVQGATSCRFSSSKTLPELPATKACAAGNVSVELKLPKNTSSSSRTFQFQLVAKGAGGTARAVPVAVVERGSASAPRIVVQPASDTAVAGSTATFDAASAGPASVQWQISTDGGRDWAIIAGANGTSYSFTASEGENGFEYRAVFSRHQRNTTTEAATLTVTQAAAAGSNHPPSSPGGGGQLDAAPAITLQPTPDGVVESAAATFTAQASGSPAPTVQWQVSADGGASWANFADPTATSATVSFAASAGENLDEYRATFTNRAGTATSAPATLYVVTGSLAPAAIASPAFDSTVYAGSQASFSAAPSGNPFPSVQWEVSTDGGFTFTAIPGANATTYSLPSATLGESGEEFKALFTNVTGQVTNQVATLPVKLTVQVAPTSPSVTSQPANQAVLLGRAATFSASAVGNPAPTVKWQVSTDHGSSWNDVPGASSPSYSFQPVAGDSGSEYRAEFTNGVGPPVDSQPATLIVGSDTRTSNWSGYVATGATFTSVTGSWTVPVATCSSSSAFYSSDWVGIDGYTSESVEQDGTDSDCDGTTPVYYAWYEMYPAGSVQLPYPVAAGDTISASVSVSGSTWTLSISDASVSPQSHASWTATPITTSSPGLAQSSAEWIAERPELCSGNSCQYTSLTNFGTVSFANATANGSPISSFANTPLEMTSPPPTYSATTLLALPGALNGSGNAFNDTWYASN